jgi:hypothetical protein
LAVTDLGRHVGSAAAQTLLSMHAFCNCSAVPHSEWRISLGGLAHDVQHISPASAHLIIRELPVALGVSELIKVDNDVFVSKFAMLQIYSYSFGSCTHGQIGELQCLRHA